MTHQALAFYHLNSIDDPDQEVEIQKEFCSQRDILARMYISKDGINGQMSASNKACAEYMEWMESRSLFQGIVFKCDPIDSHAFPKLIIKHRPLLGFDIPVNLDRRGQHIEPEVWKTMMESQEEKVIVDVRNDYESKVGTFEGAETPSCKTFREFEEYANNLKERIDPKTTPVMMCCTGGIRCEYYSAFLKEKGFEHIYQLNGGIINYGHKVGSAHWLGKLFVFDDRMTVPIADEETQTISHCELCQTPCDDYYNCANVDCNRLFLCCPTCLQEKQGCCQTSCMEAPRVRPLKDQDPHRPFRKWFRYQNM